MPVKTNVLLFAFLGALSGCSNPDNRFSSIQLGPPAKFQPPILDVTSTPADTPAKVLITNLPERAAAAYITALSQKTKTVADLQAAMAKPLVAAPTEIDNSTLSRTLLLTISPSGFTLGDRLTYVIIKITPDNFTFTGLTAVATTWGSEPIDTVDVSNNVSFAPELDATLAGSVKGTFKGPLTASHNTDVKATDVEPFQQPTANIRDGDLIFTQTGARGIDLYGTTLAKVKLAPSPGHNPNLQKYFAVSKLNLTDPSGNDLAPGKASVSISEVTGLTPVRYTATAELSYGVRHVISGAKTFREDDDTVQFINASTKPLCVVLASPVETNLGLWTVDTDKELTYIETDEGPKQIRFTSYENAQQFAVWLLGKAGSKVGSRSLWMVPTTDVGDPAARSPIPAYHTAEVRNISSEGAEQDYQTDSACKSVTIFPESGTASSP